MDLKTQLSDRVLRFDGVSEVHPDKLARFLLLGVQPLQLRTTEITPEIEKFNEFARENEQLREVGPERITLNMEWQVPKSYLELDLSPYLIEKFEKICHDYSPEEIEKAGERIEAELEEIEKRGMDQFIRTVIYILDVLRENNVVWGVGRGSSCASYILFLIGLHMVDCIKFDVPMEEFFH